MDTDPDAIRALRRLADWEADDRARIVAVQADLRRLEDAAGPLADAAGRLSPEGRLVVIEYEDRSPSPWVPHPLPFERLRTVANRAGLEELRLVGKRDSAYRGAMYCAVVERSAAP